MRWGLRFQLLVPPILLLLAVAGITTWTALASAQRVRRQLDARVRQVVEALNLSELPRNPTGYTLLKLLSGAELLELGAGRKILGGTITTVPENLPPPHTNPDDVRLDARVLVNGE